MLSSALVRARESFWLMPTVIGILAVVGAELLVMLDRSVDTAGIPILGGLSASGGRAILSGVGGSMLTVAGTSFSITISVLATTSSTYGPRLVRNFMADRGNQLVLAALTSTFIYCMVVLRAVRTEEDGVAAFVPTVAINVAVLLALIDVAVLVYFIHHIAGSVQVTTLQARVLDDLLRTFRAVYARDTPPSIAATTAGPGAGRVTARTSGYVQQLDIRSLVSIATAHDAVVHVVAMPGDHVAAGETVALFDGGAAPSRATPDETAAKKIAAAISIGDARTPHQDPRFALQQLVEMGVRGLASGTNDPYTAVSALDATAAAFLALESRHADTVVTDEAERPRLVLRWPDAAVLAHDVYRAVIAFAIDQGQVVEAAVGLAGRISRSGDPAMCEVFARELEALHGAWIASEPTQADRDDLGDVFDRVRSALAVGS